MLSLHKYSGAGNSFVVVDGRGGDAERYTQEEVIRTLCRKHGTDGLMILESSDSADFRMRFFNPDGSGGMMCGNGGRCIVAFADRLGVRPSRPDTYAFLAPDGPHRGEILSRAGELKQVRLSMGDVSGTQLYLQGRFVDTGARHLVRMVPDPEKVDVEAEGRKYRYDPAFAPQGVNVDFVCTDPDGFLRVRTYEKGVEGETLACGTGITASAIAACVDGIPPRSESDGRLHYDIHARQDDLAVAFRRQGDGFTDVFLTGPTLHLGVLEP